MLERFRQAWSAALTAPASALLRLGVTPDAVTWAGTIAACVAAFTCFPQGWLWQGALLVGLVVVSDSVDGVMARQSGRTSRWGAFLDSSLDRIADGAIFAAVALWFAWGGDSRVGLVASLVALIAGQVTSYVKARAEAGGLDANGGLIARADRLVIVLLGALLSGIGLRFALELAVLVLAVTGTITVSQRMRTVHRQVRGD